MILLTSSLSGTLLVLAVLLLAVGLIVRGMIRDRRAGKHLCGGDCGSCGGACSCSPEMTAKAEEIRAKMRPIKKA